MAVRSPSCRRRAEPPKNFGTRMTNGTAWKPKECATSQETDVKQRAGRGAGPGMENGGRRRRVRVHILQYLLLRRKLFAKLNFN